MAVPPVIPAQPAAARWSGWWWWGLPALAAAAVFFEFNPSQYGFYPRCALYVTTGIFCPGCGAQRALYQLLHGNILAALRDNALLVLALPLLIFYAGRWLLCRRYGKPLPRLMPNAKQIKWLIVGVVFFTVLRNIHHAPFNQLAPP